MSFQRRLESIKTASKLDSSLRWNDTYFGVFLCVGIVPALNTEEHFKEIWTQNLITMEYFDIIDESCNIIGKATRKECHGNTLLAHRVVHVLVFNSAGELFLQKRSSNKDIQPGKWDTSVGGHVNLGECFDDAVYRELDEELDINADVRHLYDYWMRNDIETEYVRTYICVYDGEIKFDPIEIDDGRFWRIEEIEENLGTGIFTQNFEQEFDNWKKCKTC